MNVIFLNISFEQRDKFDKILYNHIQIFVGTITVHFLSVCLSHQSLVSNRAVFDLISSNSAKE